MLARDRITSIKVEVSSPPLAIAKITFFGKLGIEAKPQQIDQIAADAALIYSIVAGLSQARQGFSCLPAVENEIKTIAQSVPTSLLLVLLCLAWQLALTVKLRPVIQKLERLYPILEFLYNKTKLKNYNYCKGSL
ncbi:hypothetical protein [Gloeothece verrucosa]|uniref:Uncharacterized protein n=1 Tax=Gloeothece verrucosa (strain PCC 7822) TaxID=497965 RepID=E0UI79_GLOV7|nr:hypothetical protein [Gloeothece verrucosa]ADN15731.1 hypothetical protein Cyan7822_3796 [Gloeothece verrucosa PCC 7822]